ncbi:MAG: T9SS type A sorting domain-containing protein [Bacteroidetes bacterium]|jgi:hypothetical protein|nr:T9SS type A sorting domain-containing protein [Bacteroidota bacterium]MBT4412142.1 T9SS type A sorting domain-containing protein [Bacteroidota bacterium]MBT5426617.1 T9SS type A sorting domain-containing protein [Bacteroidota bacterium]MBT7094256.1 T9SS type A sorting domain-containing protein [Bacteroidota bacterium]MBT7464041.1 T9SS type A sorting domain-containing protein [Bacteroidota bacterium]
MRKIILLSFITTLLAANSFGQEEISKINLSEKHEVLSGFDRLFTFPEGDSIIHQFDKILSQNRKFKDVGDNSNVLDSIVSYVFLNEYDSVRDSKIENRYDDVGDRTLFVRYDWDSELNAWLIVSKSFYYYSSSITGIMASSNISFNLFPNPTSGIINITGLTETAEVRIYSVQGQLLKSDNHIENIFDISDLPAGVYFLNLTSGKTVIKKTIVKR